MIYWSLCPATEHLHTLAYQLGRVATYGPDRIAEGQDMVYPGLGCSGRLGQGETMVQKVSTSRP